MIDEPHTNDDALNATQAELPIVTVFGAGIAGLTAAHELVERGFTVQVVEPQEHDFEEYQCAVGGLAANQFSRVRAPAKEVHHWLSEKYPNPTDPFWRVAEQFRNYPALEQTSKRFAICETIWFDKQVPHPRAGRGTRPAEYDDVPRTRYEPPSEVKARVWRDYWDDHGVVNRRKLDTVLRQIRNATLHYLFLYFPNISKQLALGRDNLTDEAWEEAWEDLGELKKHIADLADRRKFVARETFLVRIVGYTDTDGIAEHNREIAFDWANKVKAELKRLNDAAPKVLGVWELDNHLDVVVRGSANPRYDQTDPAQRKRSNRVEFEIVEQVIPGEHGFRFFPGFYRHLFDTMRRTPIFDVHGEVSGQTAFDQLVPTPKTWIAQNNGEGPWNFNYRKFISFHAMDETMRQLYDKLGLTSRDLLGLQFYMSRYLMSCPERRAQEAEPFSLEQYLGGDKRFSPAARELLQRAPRALAAMSATEADARTELDISAQFFAIGPLQDSLTDMTLNGPTSTAWLWPWKKYLKMQGVKFFVGQLKSMKKLKDHFVPVCSGPDGWVEPRPESASDLYQRPADDGSHIENHRFILALPLKEASSLISSSFGTADTKAALGKAPPPAPPAGPFAQLLSFIDHNGTRDSVQAKSPGSGGDPAGEPYFRTISGLQFFFAQQYRVADGNLYLVDSPWALTAISQFAYWRQRVKPVGDFLGQMSVDVGDWVTAAPGGVSASESSRDEIANNTWEQIKKGLAKDYAKLIDPPSYYHIDRNIVFEEIGHSGFRGSARLRVLTEAAASLSGDDRIEFTVTPSKWDEKPTVRALRLKDLRKLDAKTLAEEINKSLNDLVFAIPPEEGAQDPTELLISPMAQGDHFSYRSP